MLIFDILNFSLFFSQFRNLKNLPHGTVSLALLLVLLLWPLSRSMRKFLSRNICSEAESKSWKFQDSPQISGKSPESQSALHIRSRSCFLCVWKKTKYRRKLAILFSQGAPRCTANMVEWTLELKRIVLWWISKWIVFYVYFNVSWKTCKIFLLSASTRCRQYMQLGGCWWNLRWGKIFRRLRKEEIWWGCYFLLLSTMD